MGLRFSGDRLLVTYRILGTADLARKRAEEIAVEQTIEYPPELVHRRDILEQVVGRVEGLSAVDELTHHARISYATEIAGEELTQLLNVLLGNSSLKPGIRVVGLELPESLLASFGGPSFGRQGLRQWLGVHGRPILATAIKPMGLGPQELAELGASFARGGIDLVKDDHGLANQSFCPFEERVEAVAEAIIRANAAADTHCVYAPNVTASPRVALARGRFAKAAGARALLFAPGLGGWDTLRMLADDESIQLPILCHPALLGSLHIDPDHGFGCGIVYGELARLAGADATIFPSFGGRFSFSELDCRELVQGTERRLGNLKSIFPTPAGGLSLERIPELLRFYGPEAILLIGGDLHRHGSDLLSTCRRFRAAVESPHR